MIDPSVIRNNIPRYVVESENEEGAIDLMFKVKMDKITLEQIFTWLQEETHGITDLQRKHLRCMSWGVIKPSITYRNEPVFVDEPYITWGRVPGIIDKILEKTAPSGKPYRSAGSGPSSKRSCDAPAAGRSGPFPGAPPDRSTPARTCATF